MLPMHRRSPSAAGMAPTSLRGASMEPSVSVAAKPTLLSAWPEVKSSLLSAESAVKTTVIAPPVDVTAAGTAVPENLFSSSALVDVPSYTLTKSYLSSKLNSLKRTVIGPLADTTHMQLRERP
jgi:hypothetical protein